MTGASNRMFTATELTPHTSYTFEVAAVSNSGIGPYATMDTQTSVPLGKLYSSIHYLTACILMVKFCFKCVL